MPEYKFKVGDEVRNTIPNFRHDPHCTCCGHTVYLAGINLDLPYIEIGQAGVVTRITEIPPLERDPRIEQYARDGYTEYHVAFGGMPPGLVFKYPEGWNGLELIVE